MEPPHTEYGLINVQSCYRYILDGAYEEDEHYLSHVDGRLYVRNIHSKAPLGPNDYCVEFVGQEDNISVRMCRTVGRATTITNCIVFCVYVAKISWSRLYVSHRISNTSTCTMRSAC